MDFDDIKIKTLDERPHHYIIGVATYPATSKNAGKRFLKYGPIYFTNHDVLKLRDVQLRLRDQVFKQSEREAMASEGVTDLVMSMTSMKLAANANCCTLHHFSSTDEISDDWFEVLVDAANSSDHSRDLLEASRIG